MKTACVILVGCLCLAGSCSRTRPSRTMVAKVVVDLPGATPEMVDDRLYPHFLHGAFVLPGVKSVTAISRMGVFEGYVEVDGGDLVDLQDRLSAVIPPNRLPEDAGKPRVYLLKEGVPSVVPKMVAQLQVNLDREKLLRLGLSTTDVMTALKPPVATRALDGTDTQTVLHAVIAYRNGRPVYLHDVGTVDLVQRPDCIVRTQALK